MLTFIIIVSCFGLFASCFVIFINMVDGLPFRQLPYLIARTLFTVSLAIIGISAVLFAIKMIVGD